MPLARHRRTLFILLFCALVGLPALIGLQAPTRGDTAGWQAVLLTQSYRPKRGFVSDGSTLYSAELVGKTYHLFQTPMPSRETAESKPFSTAFKDVYLSDLSPDGMQLLVHSRIGQTEPELWILPVRGGSPTRVGSVLAHDAAWSSSGAEIAYASGRDFFVVKPNGSTPRHIGHTDGVPTDLRWAPDDSVISFTLEDDSAHTRTLWQVKPDGSDLRQLFARWHPSIPLCCADWTKEDVDYFLFEAPAQPGRTIWSVPARNLAQEPQPWPINGDGMALHQPRRTRGKPGLLLLTERVATEYARLNPQTGKLTSAFVWSGAAPVIGVTPDGLSFAFNHVDNGENFIRIVTPTGTELVDLGKVAESPTPDSVSFSPDGRTIAFTAHTLAPYKSRIYLVSRHKGQPKPIPDDGKDQYDPAWSPDGRTLAFVDMVAPRDTLKLLDVSSKEVQEIPNSANLIQESWSHDGRYLAAGTASRLAVYDRVNGMWADVPANASQGATPVWAPDRDCVYFPGYASHEPDPRKQRIMRYCLADNRVEALVTRDSLQASEIQLMFYGITKYGDLLVNHRTTVEEICMARRFHIY